MCCFATIRKKFSNNFMHLKLIFNFFFTRGGNGGGAIRLDALRRIEVVGYIQANGEIGHGDSSTRY